MYKKFTYSPKSTFYLGNNLLGKMINNNNQNSVFSRLKRNILNNENIDGDGIAQMMFPKINADIFISHSHKDIQQVEAFAGWLCYVFGLNAFIDSCVWKNYQALIKILDEKYYHELGRLYDSNRQEYVRSHVHIMLTSALTEMMDKTECILFFNTPNSVNLASELENSKRNTSSPWIYHELFMTTMLRVNKPKYKRIIKDSIEYSVDDSLEKFIDLSDDLLMKWENICREKNLTGKNALNKLYTLSL